MFQLPELSTLVSADDAAQAFNTTSSNVMSNCAGGMCSYNRKDSQAVLIVFGQSYPNADAANSVQPEQLAAAYRGMFGVSSSKAVSGIGDKAVEYIANDASGATGVALFVFKANLVMFFVMSPSTDDSAIQTIAKTAVGRLKAA